MKSQGVGKGDDVTIYMPMIPELPATMVRARLLRAGAGWLGRCARRPGSRRCCARLAHARPARPHSSVRLPPAQLACARIGAVFSVVFAGFSAESLAGRISDSSPKMVVTCSAVKRGPKHIELKKIVDEVRGRPLLLFGGPGRCALAVWFQPRCSG